VNRALPCWRASDEASLTAEEANHGAAEVRSLDRSAPMRPCTAESNAGAFDGALREVAPDAGAWLALGATAGGTTAGGRAAQSGDGDRSPADTPLVMTPARRAEISVSLAKSWWSDERVGRIASRVVSSVE